MVYTTVILENIGENLDASLDSVLTKAVFRKGIYVTCIMYHNNRHT
jgi:hypothetical protein